MLIPTTLPSLESQHLTWHTPCVYIYRYCVYLPIPLTIVAHTSLPTHNPFPSSPCLTLTTVSQAPIILVKMSLMCVGNLLVSTLPPSFSIQHCSEPDQFPSATTSHQICSPSQEWVSYTNVLSVAFHCTMVTGNGGTWERHGVEMVGCEEQGAQTRA